MIIRFDEPGAQDIARVGGKAASLGRLVQAGFPVPTGFTVTTAAQAAFYAAHGLAAAIRDLLKGLDYDSPTQLDAATAAIRELIESRPLPEALVAEIAGAYATLGADCYVAVRSSGTAEDLAEASFAGLHDTYLDIHGSAAVVDAVRRCWASMWTARATAYRERAHFDHAAAEIAVVIQRMVPSEVAGVMFTANPRNARTDEIVLNASWGLGEGIVSGILTPDEFVLARDTLQIKQRVTGAKEVQVLRAPSGVGTVQVPVSQAQSEVLCLSDAKARELAALGRKVTDFYEGIPQDIEWALAGGAFHLLQSRPVTGAEFTWDEDVDAWHPTPEKEDTVWTHTWAEQFLTGGITPLFASMRSWECYSNWSRFARIYGFDEVVDVHWFKYRRATLYYNADADKIWQQRMWPAPLRDLTNIPPAWQDEFAATATSLLDVGRMWARLHVLEPKYGLLRWFDTTYAWMNRVDEANGPSAEDLRLLSDSALKAQCNRSVELVDEFFATLWPGFFWVAGGCFGLLSLLITKWYDGKRAGLFQDLITGIPDTALVRETRDLWHLADRIRQSSTLSECLREYRDGAFFGALEGFSEGREFLGHYREFLKAHGHRGHQDRDIYYERRCENPQIDYQAFRSLSLADESKRPEQIETELVRRREAATAEILGNLSAKPMGGFKAELFKMVLAYTHRVLKFRDDERHFLDRQTLQKKRSFTELGRRMRERGLLEGEDDFYFLARHELFELFEARASRPLCRAKIAARRRVFQRRNAREEHTPTYLQAGRVLHLESRVGQKPPPEGTLAGVGTARGEVTGRARVVLSLRDIGNIQKDDILVCNSTDPGWMPVFPVIRGLVLETGGMLAHGACLAREYGLPAVQLRHAIQLIKDGTTISLNGDTGEIRIVDEPALAAA